MTATRAPGPWLGGWYLLVPCVLLAAVRGLWAPDEPRYAEVAREACEHDWLVLHLNGEVYPDKPPLVYWLAGLCGRLGGWHELALRLPSLAATLATAWLAARLARRLWGELEARWTPLFFLGTVMVLEIGGRLQLDPVLTLCVLSAVVLATDERGTRAERNARILAAGLCAGLGALAKGPVAWLPVVVGILALRSARAPSDSASREQAPGWKSWLGFGVLALLPVLAWALAASMREPMLARALFFGQHLGRVVEGQQHRGPPWEYLLQFPLFFLPWTPLFVLALTRAWRSPDRGLRALALWFGVVFVVFSAMPPKRDLYLLPIYPCAALLCARVHAQALRAGERLRGVWIPSALVWCLVGLAGLGLTLVMTSTPEIVPRVVADPERAADLLAAWDTIAPARAGLLVAFGLLLAGGIVALRGRAPAQALALASALALSVLALTVVPRIDRVKSARELALWLAARPEKPSVIPCLGVQPEGYRFYGRVPAAKVELEPALAREGAAFLGLVTQREYERLAPEVRARVRVLEQRSVGSRDVVVLGAAGH